MPKRSADTMSDAIALSSPSGSMSKRARRAAEKRLHQALFGDGKESLKGPPNPQPSPATFLRRQAAILHDLANRGMKPRAYAAEARRLEAKADTLQPTKNPKIERNLPCQPINH